MVGEESHVLATSTTAAVVGNEINELRKYIVELMHSEMELMESIKQNKDNVAAVNARINQLKELIAQEHSRYKTLKSALAGDTKELEHLEEKQIVVEAKHRQYQDAVTQRESEVRSLRQSFQFQRSAMVSLRRQIMDATTRLEAIASLETSIDKEMQDVSTELSGCADAIVQPADLPKLRAKLRYINQHIIQMGEETSQLCEKRTQLEAEVDKCKRDTKDLRNSLVAEEKEAELLLSRLREDTRCVTQEKARIEAKLKTKRKKFRMKTKNEISSFKRRISFIASELERVQMPNEDSLSAINALSAKREALDLKQITQAEQISNAEKAVAELSGAITAFDRGNERFNTSRLQTEKSSKSKAAQIAQTKLDEKQRILDLLEADRTQLTASLEDINARIEAAATTELDEQMSALATNIQELEAQSKRLNEALCAAKKLNQERQDEWQAHKSKNKDVSKTHTKLRRQRDALNKEEKIVAVALSKEESLSRVLGEGIKHGNECMRQLHETQALLDNKKQQMEFELRHQELKWQQHCADEEKTFQAEVAAWDAKIENVERQMKAC